MQKTVNSKNHGLVLFSIIMQFSSIQPIHRTLSGATTPGQNGPGSDGNKGVLRIPQSSSITATSPSDCLASYQGHLLVGVLPLSREAVGVFYNPPPRQLSIQVHVDCFKILEFLKIPQ